MIRVDVVSDGDTELPVRTRRAVVRICRHVLHAENRDGWILSVLITRPETSLHLNRTWRHGDYVANVLSFPGSGEPLTPRSRLRHLGDLAVCPTVAAREAAGTDTTPEQRLAHLLIHGVLHLLGYDHVDDQSQARVMEAREDTLLATLDPVDVQRLSPLFSAPFADMPSVT